MYDGGSQDAELLERSKTPVQMRVLDSRLSRPHPPTDHPWFSNLGALAPGQPSPGAEAGDQNERERAARILH